MSKTMTEERILQVFPLLLTRVIYLDVGNAGQAGKARTKHASQALPPVIPMAANTEQAG